MKSLILLAFAASGAVVIAESAIPTAFGKERYEETASQSPFVLATPPEAPPDDAKGPLKDLMVTGIGKLDDGQALVFVQRMGEDRSMKFEGNQPNDEGLSVKLVKWGERWDKTTVVMRHNTDEAEIRFKDKPEPTAGIAAAGQAGGRQSGPGGNQPPPIVPNVNRPGVVGGSNVQKPQSITPNIPRPNGTQPNRGVGSIPGPNTSFRGSPNLSNSNTAIPQPNAPQQPNGGAPRVRVRTINNR